MPPSRKKREYGLTSADRSFEIVRKFGSANELQVKKLLNTVINPTEQVLGAIIFLARPGFIVDIETNVLLANQQRDILLGAATVKDERG
jgi:hypothetical protein